MRIAVPILLAIAPAVFAQTSQTVEFEWGGLHPMPSQVLALNVHLGDDCASLSVPVVLEAYDRDGNVVARALAKLSTGRTVTIAIGPNNTSVAAAIGADAYLVLPTDTHVLVPCLKITFPPGPCRAPTDLLTATMETIDAASGRLMSFANNPHTLIE